MVPSQYSKSHVGPIWIQVLINITLVHIVLSTPVINTNATDITNGDWRTADEFCKLKHNTSLPVAITEGDIEIMIETMKERGWTAMWTGRRRVLVNLKQKTQIISDNLVIDSSLQPGQSALCGRFNGKTNTTETKNCNISDTDLICHLTDCSSCTIKNDPLNCFFLDSKICFVSMQTKVSWNKTQKECEKLGGKLATLRNYTKEDSESSGTSEGINTNKTENQFFVEVENKDNFLKDKHESEFTTSQVPPDKNDGSTIIRYTTGIPQKDTGLSLNVSNLLQTNMNRSYHCVLFVNDNGTYGWRSEPCDIQNNFTCFLPAAVINHGKPNIAILIVLLSAFIILLVSAAVASNLRVDKNRNKNVLSKGDYNLEEPLITKETKLSNKAPPALVGLGRRTSNVVFKTYQCTCNANKRDLVLVPRIYAKWFSNRTLENDMEVILHIYLVDINSCKEDYLKDLMQTNAEELVPVGKTLLIGSLGYVDQNDIIEIVFSSNNPVWTEKGGNLSEAQERTTLGSVVSCHTKGLVPLAAQFVFGSREAENVFHGNLQVNVQRAGQGSKGLTMQQYFRVETNQSLKRKKKQVLDSIPEKAIPEGAKFPQDSMVSYCQFHSSGPSKRQRSKKSKKPEASRESGVLAASVPLYTDSQESVISTDSNSQILRTESRSRSVDPAPVPKGHKQEKQAEGSISEDEQTLKRSRVQGFTPSELFKASSTTDIMDDGSACKTDFLNRSQPTIRYPLDASSMGGSVDTFCSDAYMNLIPPPSDGTDKTTKTKLSVTEFIVNNITSAQFDTLWEKGLRLNELDLMDFIIEFCSDQKEAHRRALEHWLSTTGSLQRLVYVMEKPTINLGKVAADVRKLYLNKKQ